MKLTSTEKRRSQMLDIKINNIQYCDYKSYYHIRLCFVNNVLVPLECGFIDYLIGMQDLQFINGSKQLSREVCLGRDTTHSLFDTFTFLVTI